MLYDISPQIDSNINVWPGDEAPSRHVSLDIEKGDNISLSALHSTVHLGAHVDAPSHFCADGASIGECPLDPYLGRCQVMSISIDRGASIMPHHITEPIVAERILFKTQTFPNPASWNNDFAALSPELIDHLATYHTKLVGIDTPSVDLFHAHELHTHNRILANNMSILEGIILDAVPDGLYELIALPLKLFHFDASPVRAILRACTND